MSKVIKGDWLDVCGCLFASLYPLPEQCYTYIYQCMYTMTVCQATSTIPKIVEDRKCYIVSV